MRELPPILLREPIGWLRLNASLIPLPDDGSGIRRFGLPLRAKRGLPLYPKKTKPAKDHPYAIPPPFGRARAPERPITILLPAHIAIYCPDCGTKSEISVEEGEPGR